MNTITRTSHFIDQVVYIYSVQIWRKYSTFTHTTQIGKQAPITLPYSTVQHRRLYQFFNSKTKLTGTSLSVQQLFKQFFVQNVIESLTEI